MPRNPDEDYQIPEFEENEPASPQEENFPGETMRQEETSFASLPPESPQASYAPPPQRGVGADRRVVNLTADIPVQMVAVLGKKTITVKEVIAMKMGQVIELNRLPNEAIDLVANGKLIAKGEVVEVDGRLGVRILKIFD